MKVDSITIDGLALQVTPMGNRLYRIARDTRVSVKTDEGSFDFCFKAGFVTNFRSGGPIVDRFVDQVGDEKKALCYLVHDAIYTPCASLGGHHPVSREKGDELLRAALLWAKMETYKAVLVYYSVRWFGESAYEEDDALTSLNSRLFDFEWTASGQVCTKVCTA